MAKVRKFNGGGMKSNYSKAEGPAGGASAGGNYGGNVNPEQTYAGKAYKDQPYAGGTGTSGNGKKTKVTTDKTTVKTDKPKFVPSIAYNLYQGVKKWSDAQNLEKRTKFARDEGLTRDWAKTHQYSKTPTLDVMSTEGKDYLKEAGYGPFQDKKDTGGNGDGQQLCPDGSMPPCPPAATTAPTPTSTSTSTPTNTGWQFYPTNSNYLTGEGYDRGGGVRFGPPPTKGPNPQVPPVKFSRGGGCAIRGTKFSGVK